MRMVGVFRSIRSDVIEVVPECGGFGPSVIVSVTEHGGRLVVDVLEHEAAVRRLDGAMIARTVARALLAVTSQRRLLGGAVAADGEAQLIEHFRPQ